MKSFIIQFKDCRREGFCKGTIRQKLTTDLMPCCPSKARAFRRNNITYLKFIKCGRFGGICSSKHLKCNQYRKVQGYDGAGT